MDDQSRKEVQPWITLSREEILDCRIFSVLRLRRRSQATGAEREFYALDSRDWVNVVAVTRDRELVLVRQYRQGSDEISLEVPGGIADGEESVVETALRELEEETGYRSEKGVEIARVRPNPAILDNWLTIVLALDAEPTGTTRFDESEEIDLVLEHEHRIEELIRSGAITHAYSVMALMLYRQWQATH